MSATLRLRDLPASGRLALSLLLLVLLGGFAASAVHLDLHHENRDERPGLSLDDLRGAYHGVRSRAPLLVAIEGDHPGEIEGQTALPAAQRSVLLKWLQGDRITQDYDNLDLGANAPAEILAARCVSCHSRQASDEAAKQLPLDYFDDVKKLAVSRDIAPTDTTVLVASTHTHAIALATTTLVVAFLMLLTRWPMGLRSGLALAAALGLGLDLAGWWLARGSVAFVYAIVGGGALFGCATGLMGLAILIDLWRPLASSGSPDVQRTPAGS